MFGMLDYRPLPAPAVALQCCPAPARRRLSLCPVEADRSSILQTAMTDTRIVTTAYRYKPPPRKRKAVAIAGPAIVRKRGRADVVPPPDEPKPAAPPPANDDRNPPPPGARKPGIATSISRKRTKFLRTEQAAEPEPDDPEATARVRAWLERAKWGHGPAR